MTTTQQEHKRPQQPEKVHGLYTEFVGEPECGKVEIAVYEAVKPEFGGAVFSSLVFHHLLSDFVESGVFCEVGYVAVHVAVNLYSLHNLLPVGFQSAIEIMQVLDAAYFAGCGVEEFCGYGFRQGVIAFLLPTAYKVISILCNHAVKLRDFIGGIL